MILDELLKIVYPIMEQGYSMESILEQGEINAFDTSDLTNKSDQEITDFIEANERDIKKQKQLFEIFRKIKLEKSIEVIEETIEGKQNEDEKGILESLLSKEVEPENIKVNGDTVCVTYDFSENSNLKNKIYEIKKWDSDHVVETVSEKFSVPIENVVLVNSVSSYIDFIGSFDESDYVSRGQKDCTFDLRPSLYRLYQNGYVGHASQYEIPFKQRLLYYDDKTDNKSNEELRAYGQHFGLPTNYLDFTEAHLTSLLFAVEEYDYTENHSIVFFVDALSYNRETIKSERKLVDFSDQELKATLQREYGDKTYFISVGNCNERIHFQKGCFLKVEKGDSLQNMFAKYTKIAIIDKNSKKAILKELFKLGITFENIYPDKDNMVKTIRFIKEHMQER